MSLKNKKVVPIKYTSRDFSSIKNDLIEYSKKFYPDTYKDFSESSFGSLLFDTIAYTGDILSFYLDYQANESFLDTAVEYNNIVRLGKEKGYKFLGNPSSIGKASFFILVPARVNALGPDPDYIPVLKKGSSFKSVDGASFLLNEDVDFALSTNEIVVGRVDDSTGVPTYYAIKAVGQVISGQLMRKEIEIGTFEKFKRIDLGVDDVAEIHSVFDSEGHQYYEVEHLSQNVVYRPVLNTNAETKEQVTYILKPFVVARRFVVERERRNTFLQFGFGSDAETAESSVAEPTEIVLQVYGKDYITDEFFDPSRLLKTDKFGIAPSNTTLTIVYRMNTADNVNVSVGSLNSVVRSIFYFKNNATLAPSQVAFIRSSLEVENENVIVGDITLPTSEELKMRIRGAFAAQGRAVTEEDYKALVYSMPPKYGAIKRAAIYKDNGSFRRNLNLYVISEDANEHLVACNADLKKNLKTWLVRNKMISDTIDILDAKIINFGIEYEVIPRLDKNKFDILTSCNNALENYFMQKKDISEGIMVSDLYTVLNRVSSVVDTTNVQIVLKSGGLYSDIRIDLDDLLTADGRFLTCPKNCIYELKFPVSDIKGAIK